MKRLLSIVLVIICLAVSSIPVSAVSGSTCQTVEIVGSCGCIKLDGIDTVRINKTDKKIYETAEPVYLTFLAEDLTYRQLNYYPYASYTVNEDGGVHISTGAYWLERGIFDNKAIITESGLYRVRLEVGEEVTTIWIYSTITPVTASLTESTVSVDGEQVSFEAYNINGSNYIKLRDLAFVLSGTSKQFDVAWNDKSKSIEMTSGIPYTSVGGELAFNGDLEKTASPTASKVYVDGQRVIFKAYNIEGTNYFKLRDIAETFDFGVTWDSSGNAINIDTSAGYTSEN